MTATELASAPQPTSRRGAKTASTQVPLHHLLADRWSPRAFDGSHHLRDQELTGLLEAARWAPSANNSQPWRFVVARRGTELFEQIHAALNPGNQVWAGNASALVLLAAEVVDANGSPRPYAMYDTGQAAAHLSTQACTYGLSVHQMAGFDVSAMTTALDLAADVVPVVVMAVGRHDPSVQLSESLALREQAPRTRRPLSELVIATNHVERISA